MDDVMLLENIFFLKRMDLVKLNAFGDWSKLQLPTKEKREEILKYQLLIYAKVEDERERDQETSLKKREMKKKEEEGRPMEADRLMHAWRLIKVSEREREVNNKSKMSAYFWVLV